MALRFCVRLFLGLISVSIGSEAQGSDLLEKDIAHVYGEDEDVVSIAAGYRQPLDLAPAVATVITAEEIRAMGATTLDQVIETVAGVHLSTPDDIVNVLSFRGIPSRVLILVNNIPVPQGLVNAFAPRGNLLVNNVERIEVIRGPGSAVYGADAMAGVVNIVTKTANDINGSEIGGRAGSFDTYEGWFLHGGQWGEADVAVSLQGRTTNGFDKIVDADAQTRFDALFGTRASRAPSAVNAERDVVDVHADISNGPWTWRAGYFGQFDIGTGVGFSSSLDPDGEIDVGLFNTDFTYHDRYSDHWDITAELSYVYGDIDARLALFPPGAFGGAFPDGVRQELDIVENRVRAEFTTLYSGLKGRLVRVGLGGFYDSFDNTEDRRNYIVRRGLLAPTGIFAEGGGTGDVPLFPDTDRGIFYTYLQDEWLFAPDWHLTSGVRVDHYSDFGPSVNPRIGLVWNTGYRLTTKLLYGRAFRPPSVTELHSNGILLGLGDPDLDPVTIDTTELSFNYRAAPFRSNLNFFWYRLDDIIELASNRASPNGLGFANNGAQEGYGLEWEFDWAITPTFTLRGNYGYQKPMDGGENVNLRFAPRHQVYGEAGWRFAPGWELNASVKSIIDRERAGGDPRPPVDDYSIVTLSLQRRNIANHIDVAIAARNLLDEDAREPSDSPTSIPFDIPLAGREIYGELRFRF